MTRKDYKLIAEILRAERPRDSKAPSAMLWRVIRDRLVAAFADENEAFDIARFREACDA